MHECGNSHGYLLCMMFVLHVIIKVGIVSGHSAVPNVVKAAEEEETKHNSNCASTKRVKRHDHARFPSSPPTGTTFGKALRFYGREVVRFSGAVKIPSHQLTVDLWVKPEGGQPSPVTVLGLFDDCSPESKDGGWVIGFQEASPERSLRVFFTLRTQRSQRITTLLSPRSVEPNVWLHIAVTFDGKKMKLYINQAEVAISTEQKGHVFANGLHVCENLEAGGNRSSGVFFRGTLDEVRLWSVAKSHEDISSNVFVPLTVVDPSLEMHESFAGKEDLNRNQKTTWIAVTKNQPEIVQSTIPSDAHYLSIFKPPCGTTVCDNAEIVKSYRKNTHLRGAKVVRYRVVNLRDDDGSNPMVTKEQMKRQHAQLNKAFKPHNISFELTELSIRNSSLRRRSVMYLCEPGTIGDGMCNFDCKSEITGNDGGDCDKPQTLCHPDKRGNGRCDPECNRYYNNWDFGDCCNESITDVYKTCFDPKSPNRAYISVRDYKSIMKLDNKRFLNVFVARLSNKNLHGLATFPWEKSVHSIYGGIIMSVKDFGHQGHLKALVHEFGHVLGLWHVFHGVTEMDCTDECAENFPSLELGDLCSDTNPTPANFLCSDPVSSMTCGRKFYNTPFKNYMGLANDSCTDSFTEQQAARMHCYLDLIHQSSQDKRKPPSFIPLPPRVTFKGKESIKLAWIPPLGTGGANAVSGCHECRENRVFQQYAVTAESPKPSRSNGYWAPHQAIGAPDAEPCVVTPKAWTPLTMDDCQECYIELGFKEAVIPTRLSVWVTRESKAGISDIQLVFTDDSRQSLGNATAQCDSPLTIGLKVKRKVTKVVIYVNNPLTAIDAVQLTSSLNHPNCLKCEPMEYLVTRMPPFSSGKSERVKTTRFEDRHLPPSRQYIYTVQAVTSSGLEGPPSPSLVYSPDQGFCGDGKVEEEIGEECDDANVRDGDGCNVRCKKEDVFHCTGHPSLCYRHEGDGKCEEFEKKTSIKDCGFYTPEGFDDQWASSVTVNSDVDKHRLERVIPGPAPRDLICLSEPDSEYRWSYCKKIVDCDFSLDVTFNRLVVPVAVVLYIASDGKGEYSAWKKSVKVELIDATGRVYPAGINETTLSCKANPAVIPIYHDMTKPFLYARKVRIRFKSNRVAIAGIALRSRTQFDAMELSRCQPDEVFSPRTRHCHNYMCERPSCHELNVKHASAVKCEGTEEGQTCAVTCKQGYRPMKSFKLMCLNKEWQGINRACVPVSCGVPRIPNGYADCPEGYTFGKRCSLSCVPQAKMSSGEGRITCEEDGKWSAQTAFCVMTCPNPQAPKNSLALLESNCLGSKRTFLPGMACKFRCKPGYRVKERNQPVRRTLKLRCTKSGTWTGSTCEPIECKKIPDNTRIWYNCTDGLSMGSVCIYQCPGDEVHEIKCEEDGLWSHPFKRCKSPMVGQCPKPIGSRAVLLVCEDYYPGGVCKAECKNDKFHFFEEGNVEKERVTIKCTQQLEWSPDPTLLQCMPACMRENIGDGRCDSRNNNKLCHWDGGDCCASTRRYRIFLWPSCRAGCACKDPDARENSQAVEKDDEDDEEDEDDNNEEGSGTRRGNSNKTSSK